MNLIDNRVGKILSVVALVFLPPTLIAAIYGMNFHHMPELGVRWAYTLTLVAMLSSAVMPYLIFKWKRWL
jgi:magnesium transporter